MKKRSQVENSEKKQQLLSFQTGVESMTFQIPVGRSNHWAMERGHILGFYVSVSILRLTLSKAHRRTGIACICAKGAHSFGAYPGFCRINPPSSLSQYTHFCSWGLGSHRSNAKNPTPLPVYGASKFVRGWSENVQNVCKTFVRKEKENQIISW